MIITFGSFGDKDVSSLLACRSPTHFLKDLISLLRGEVPHTEDVTDTGDDTDSLDSLVSCIARNHTLAVSLWKGISKWMEKGEIPFDMKPLLLATVSKYASFNLNDSHVFMILKFLSTFLLKMFKKMEIPSEMYKDIAKLQVTLYTSVTDQNLDQPVLEFISLYCKSLRSLLKNPDVACSDTAISLSLLLQCTENISHTNFDLVFHHITKCTPYITDGMMIPVIYRAGSVRVVTVYLLVLLRICGYLIASSPAQSEEILLSNLLSYPAVRSTLAADSLVFLCRLAPEAYTESVVALLTSLLHRTQSCLVLSRTLSNMIARLLPLLPSTSLHTYLDTALSERRMELINQHAIGSFKNLHLKRVDIVANVVKLWFDDKAATESFYNSLQMESTPLVFLQRFHKRLASVLDSRRNDNATVVLLRFLRQCLRGLLAQFRNGTTTFTGPELIAVMESLECIALLNDPVSLVLISECLVKMAAYKSTASPGMFSKKVCKLWTVLLSCNHVFIRYRALLSFSLFALITPHTEILTQLAENRTIKDQLSSFLGKSKPDTFSGGVARPEFSFVDFSGLGDAKQFENRLSTEILLKELASKSHWPRWSRATLEQCSELKLIFEKLSH